MVPYLANIRPEAITTAGLSKIPLIKEQVIPLRIKLYFLGPTGSTTGT